MNTIENVSGRKERAPFVRFDRQAREDKARSIAMGQYIAKDVDVVKVTPPDSKDIFIQDVNDWFAQMEVEVHSGRFYPEWLERFKAQYAAWKKGEELPLNGTAIKGWGVISPAQQETLIRMNIFTVEDACELKEDELRRIGMGGLDIRNKARTWIAQMKDKGGVTMQMSAMQAENATLKVQVDTLSRQVSTLLEAAKIGNPSLQAVSSVSISASDLLDGNEYQKRSDYSGNLISDEFEERAALAVIYKQKHGKAPHPAINIDTLRERVK